MARCCDLVFPRDRTWWLVVACSSALAVMASAAEGGFDRTGWLELYDSPVELNKAVAVAYAYGIANGLTIAEAYDCTGVEMSGNGLADTVAVIARKGFELKLAVPMALTVHRCRTTASGVFGKSR